ncbi:hypothetical protein GCM10011487_57170 [Steroidobacter agaridevorans]|uniref:Uncharacterized protein n=1 Tax=Steroidobacter agaridevorans TaxID=2695856 RepID=A0A829YK39_9GAMM|nr:hypothetical protein [Steroidobacter agaridevorans]GFE83717.1 hypothetical protein GCM10011487_57170 [Steroidobacter agaridevorans]
MVRALTFIGGSPQLIVPDSARALIADPDRYEPGASLTVHDLMHHYDTADVAGSARVDRRTMPKQRWPSRCWSAGSSLVCAATDLE